MTEIYPEYDFFFVALFKPRLTSCAFQAWSYCSINLYKKVKPSDNHNVPLSYIS